MNKLTIRERLFYQISFSVVNWVDATVYLLSLGYYTTGWPVRYASWWAKRYISKKKGG